MIFIIRIYYFLIFTTVDLDVEIAESLKEIT